MDIINKRLKACKTSREVYLVMSEWLKGDKHKYAIILVNSLRKQTNFAKSMQLAYNYLLNQEWPTKANDVGYARHKGTAIGGMECHSPRL